MTAVHTISRRAVLAAIPPGIAMRFVPEAAGALDCTFELRVDECAFALRIRDRRCTVERRSAPDAGAHVTVSAGDVARLVTGTVQWPALLAAGRLELTGDPFLALRFPTLFGFAARG